MELLPSDLVGLGEWYHIEDRGGGRLFCVPKRKAMPFVLRSSGGGRYRMLPAMSAITACLLLGAVPSGVLTFFAFREHAAFSMNIVWPMIIALGVALVLSYAAMHDFSSRLRKIKKGSHDRRPSQRGPA